MLLFLTFRLRFFISQRTVRDSESYKNKHTSKKIYVVTDRATISTTTAERPPSVGTFLFSARLPPFQGLTLEDSYSDLDLAEFSVRHLAISA